MIGARAALLGLLLAIGVTIAYRGIVNLVTASGARDQPALILILLLSAFLGVLVAVATRTLRLPGATAPTALVLGWTLIPVIMEAIPSGFTQLFGGPGDLTANQALALATACRHPAIALEIAHATFPEDTTAGTVVVGYVLVSMACAGPYIWWERQKKLGLQAADAAVAVERTH